MLSSKLKSREVESKTHPHAYALAYAVFYIHRATLKRSTERVQLQLDQELRDKELLVKQMDGYEQTISVLKAKLDQQNTV